MATPLRKTSRRALISYLQALAHMGGSASEKQLSTLLGSSSTTVRHATQIIQHCALVEVADGLVTATTKLPHPLTAEAAANLLATALASRDSFVELAALLMAGHDADDAVRRACMVEHAIADESSGTTILAVAQDLELLDQSADGKYSLAAAFQTPAAEYVAASMATGSAQLALRQILGADAFRALERTERDRLGLAIQSTEADPEKACEDAGKAVENYLRLVASGNGVDVSRCNGLAEVADALAAKGTALIRPQHRVMAQTVAMSRNASGHDRDKHTLQSWLKTPAFARASVLLSTRLIASVHAWIREGKQTL